MKGGSAAARKPLAPSGGKTADSKPGKPAAAAGKGAPAKAPFEEDPFEVESQQAAKAIPLSPKPSGAKTLALKCPMCETVGYTLPKLAGQDVKCCNPNCLVPIFKAPARTPEAASADVAAESAARKPTPVSVYVVAAVFLVALIGVSIWYLGPGSAPKPAAAPPAVAAGAPSGAGLSLTAPAAGSGQDGGSQPAAAQQSAAAVPAAQQAHDQINRSLARGVEIALAAPAIRKAYCRRMAALGAARAGEWKAVVDQLDQLQRVGSQAIYEAIPPSVLLAWHELGQSRAAFERRVEELERLVETLPVRGRFATQAAIEAAAVLVAAGKPQDALALIEKHRAPPLVEHLAAALEVAMADGTFSLDREFPGRSAGDWVSPPTAAVTLLLCLHGRWDDGLNWASGLHDAGAREEALLCWAEQMAQELLRQDKTSQLERVQAATERLAPAGQARWGARLARHYLAAGNQQSAAEVLAAAEAQLDALAEPPLIKVTSAKSVLDARLPDGAPLLQAADAAAEAAAAQAALGRQGPAWQSILRSLKFARGLGPSLIPVQARLLQLGGEGADDIRNELKTSLQLRNEDQIRRTLSQYRQQLTDLAQAAQTRYRAQGRILEMAAELGLLQEAWDELQRLDARPDPNEREPLLSSAVPLIIAERFGNAGNSSMRDKIRKAVESRVDEADAYQVQRALPVFTQQLIDGGQLEAAASQLNQSIAETGELQEWALRLCNRLVALQKEGQAVALLSSLHAVALREDGYFLLAAQAAAGERGAQFQAAVPAGATPTEASAMHSGLIAGWSRHSAAK